MEAASRPRVERDRVAMLYRSTSSATFLTAGMATLVVLVSWRTVAWQILLLWLLAVVVLRVLVEWLGRLYYRTANQETNARRWGWIYSWAVLPSAALWGAAIFFPGLEADQPAQLLVSLCLVARTAGSMLTHSYFPPALYTSALPLIGALMWRYASLGNTSQVLAAAMWLIMLIYILSIGHQQARLVVSTILLGHENEQLIAELKQKNLDEAAARDKAEQASLAKSRFFAAANHDLRQPLHALGLFASTLRNSQLDGNKKQLVEQIMQSIESLESLFDDLLDISRLDAGQVKPRVEHFSATALLDRVRNSYAAVALEKDLELRVHPSSLTLFSDPALLFRILSNLVMNAIRYTNRGGVLVGLRRYEDKVLIQVWDTGIGIPVDQQEKIFEEFYQLHNPERDRRKGLGLGLATVKRIAILMDHSLTLRSRVGKGTVFSIEVPLGLEAQPDYAKTIEDVKAPDLLADRTILVMDDEASVRIGMQSLLESWGCHCVATADAEEALSVLKNQVPDFIIADLRLGDNRNGIDAVRILRAALGDNIPAVVLSGDTATERIREVSAAGLTMLHKPLKAIRLRALLNHEFARRKH
ncbi:MAG: response regulator [Candidatus Obscuribacterales bacterium]|nr:response regulator [Steroidobacteraceae bacterium]